MNFIAGVNETGDKLFTGVNSADNTSFPKPENEK
jgi:hypothetical protein